MIELIQKPNQEPLIDSEIVIVLGRRGSGKSTTVKYFILPALPRFVLFDQTNEYEPFDITPASNIPDFLDLLEMGDNIRIPANTIDFETVCKILNSDIKNYYLVVDEFHMLYEHHASFQAEYPTFKQLVLLGRHKGIGLVVITQRPRDLPLFLLSQSTQLYVFNVYHKGDLKYLSNILNDVEEFQTLETFEYYHIKLGTPITQEKKKLDIF